MNQIEVGLIGLAILAILLLIGMDVGYTMLITGFIGYALIANWGGALTNLAILPFDTVNNYTFAVLPLFMLMGMLVSKGRIGADAYDMARTWFGQFKGGLAMATVLACGLFAAIQGTTLAGSLVMGKVAYPEMRKSGYKMSLAAGVISVGGTLGTLIPPSMGFILIGILAELSIGQLFMAGILPGITVIIFYMATIFIWCKVDPNVAVATPKTSWKAKGASLRLTWPVVLLFLLIMGGIYGGIFTATEAGAVGSLGALLIPLARKQLKGGEIWDAFWETAKMTAMIVILLAGAYMFNSFLAITQIPNQFGEYLLSLPLPIWGTMFFILVFYVVAGTFFDPISVLILTVPIFYPAVKMLGFDLIWYSVIMVRLIEIGQISPPAGINLFGLKGVIDAPMGQIFRGVIPFLVADLFNIILLCLFPIISTFLPDLM
jgi:C4-dicarboxylate transporter DctM subunit